MNRRKKIALKGIKTQFQRDYERHNDKYFRMMLAELKAVCTSAIKSNPPASIEELARLLTNRIFNFIETPKIEIDFKFEHENATRQLRASPSCFIGIHATPPLFITGI